MIASQAPDNTDTHTGVRSAPADTPATAALLVSRSCLKPPRMCPFQAQHFRAVLLFSHPTCSGSTVLPISEGPCSSLPLLLLYGPPALWNPLSPRGAQSPKCASDSAQSPKAHFAPLAATLGLFFFFNIYFIFHVLDLTCVGGTL